jgi:hypothetical protein
MKKLIKMPSIERFNKVVTNISRQHNFVGLDENGDAIYDHSKPKPVIKFKGTVKLHGTNASVAGNEIGGIWAQSKESIITPTEDNAGFAFYVESKKEVFKDLMNQVSLKEQIDLNSNTVTIYGEWAGKGIQKNIAISNIPKSFFIFGVKISPFENEGAIEGAIKQPVAYWVDSDYLRSPENNIYNIEDFETFEVEVDFNVPQLSVNKIIDMTLKVEEECPVGKAFGFIGIGEGIVFSYRSPEGVEYRFKSKGEKHANSKVKTLKPVDDERINHILKVVQQITPAWRLEQMLNETFDLLNGNILDVKKLGVFIKAVMNDIIKEEMDVLTENNVEPKEIGKYVSDIARTFYFDKEREQIGM